MKRFASILSLLAIAINLAVATMGGAVLCQHISGDSHLMVPEAGAVDSGSSSCEAEADGCESQCGELCSSCTDTDLGESGSDNLLPQSSKDRPEAPTAVDLAFCDFALSSLFDPNRTSCCVLYADPPIAISLARMQQERTVLLI